MVITSLIILIVFLIIIIGYKLLTKKMSNGVDYNKVVYCIEQHSDKNHKIRMTYFCRNMSTTEIEVWVPYYNKKLIARLKNKNYYLVNPSVANPVSHA